eukprot:g14465.t1.2.5e17418c g14465  g14465.t1 contig9:1897602-1900193(+)
MPRKINPAAIVATSVIRSPSELTDGTKEAQRQQQQHTVDYAAGASKNTATGPKKDKGEQQQQRQTKSNATTNNKEGEPNFPQPPSPTQQFDTNTARANPATRTSSRKAATAKKQGGASKEVDVGGGGSILPPIQNGGTGDITPGVKKGKTDDSRLRSGFMPPLPKMNNNPKKAAKKGDGTYNNNDDNSTPRANDNHHGATGGGQHGTPVMRHPYHQAQVHPHAPNPHHVATHSPMHHQPPYPMHYHQYYPPPPHMGYHYPPPYPQHMNMYPPHPYSHHAPPNHNINHNVNVQQQAPQYAPREGEVPREEPRPKSREEKPRDPYELPTDQEYEQLLPAEQKAYREALYSDNADNPPPRVGKSRKRREGNDGQGGSVKRAKGRQFDPVSDSPWATQHQNVSEGGDAEQAQVYDYSTEHRSKSWDDMIGVFRQFVETNGHSDVEWNDKPDQAGGYLMGPKTDAEKEALILRSWVRELRWVRRAIGGFTMEDRKANPKVTRRKDGTPVPFARCDSETLTLDRVIRLDKFNFPWRNDRSVWDKWIDDLLHFKAKNGGVNTYVPLKFAEYPALGNFVNRQRSEYRKLMQGRSSSMTTQKIRDLESVGFKWSSGTRDGGNTTWEHRLQELIDYQAIHGDCNVPKLYALNPSLGYWVNEQRFQYGKMTSQKPTYMTSAKIAALNSIGFVWHLRKSKTSWMDWMEKLDDYKQVHKNLDVPLKYEHDPSLGTFVNNQRSEYRKYKRGDKSSMTEEKIRQLESMGFRWSVRENRVAWSDRFDELKAYIAKYGDADVPNAYVDNPKLSEWVNKQRSVSVCLLC